MSFLSRILPGRVSAQKLQVAEKQIKTLHAEMKEMNSRMYAAAMVSRLTADWAISQTSANAEIFVSRKAAISRSRELERDNPYMRRALKVIENNVVGANGIGLQMRVRKPGNLSADVQPPVDRDACLAVQRAWERAGRAENCTVTKVISRRKLLRMAIRSWTRDGGILMRKRRGPMILIPTPGGNKAFPNNPFNYALEPVEIDRLDHDLNRPAFGNDYSAYSMAQDAIPSTNKIQFGIEFNELDAPVAYHILTRHPGDVFQWRSGAQYRERVPADEIICLFTPERAGQFVGMPDTCAVMVNMNHLGRYDEAEVVAARVAACKGGFYEKSVPESYTGLEDAVGNSLEELSPGFNRELPKGWTWKPYDPTHPTEAYAHFIKAQLRGMASGLGLSYHVLANDLEGVSFSSIRSGTLEDREEYRTMQQDLIEDLLVPWFEDWLVFALLAGQVEGYGIEDYARLNSPKWKPRTWEWVNPLQDVQADRAALASGFTSRRRIVADYTGEDVEVIDHERMEDKQCEDDHDLTPDLPMDTPPPQGSNDDNAPILQGPKKFGMKSAIFLKNGHRRSLKIGKVKWRCDDCNETDTGFVGGDADVPESCPSCGSKKIQNEYTMEFA